MNSLDQHSAFYTKYRPQKWSEVIGQEHVTDVLKETINSGKIAHAYLFTGSRGTGKTSVARILAREIGTSQKDLYEMDAASQTGVDNIRELTEGATVMPFDSKYKVYILDEVHMLSKPAFNALLKTLEEPPKHVVFILATTEPHKLPDTVISRCESYNFKTPNKNVLKKMAEDIAKKEGYILDSAGSELVALVGDGSFRDTHTILQKLIRSSKDKKLTLDEVERVTGSPKSEIINQVISAIFAGSEQIEKGLSAIRFAEENNLDPKLFMKMLLDKLRVLLVMKIAPNKKDLFEHSLTEDDLLFLREIVNNHSDKISSQILLRFLEAYEEMLKAYLPYLPIELALIDCHVSGNN